MPCIWPRQLPFDELRARSYQFIFAIAIHLRATSMVITLLLIGRRIFSRESPVMLLITLCEFGILRRLSEWIISLPIRMKWRLELKSFIDEIQRGFIHRGTR